MEINQIIELNGPVGMSSTITHDFTVPGGNYAFFVFGSAFSSINSDQTISVTVKIDSTPEGTLKIWANNNIHMSLVPLIFTESLSVGIHHLELDAGLNTIINEGDNFVIAIVEQS